MRVSAIRVSSDDSGAMGAIRKRFPYSFGEPAINQSRQRAGLKSNIRLN